VTVDGCGAPLFSTTVLGLARAFGRIAAAPVRGEPGAPAARVAAAMTALPELVGGTGREATRAMAAVPGLVVKDGASGVYAAGLADGGALAFKVLDGSARARPVLLAAAARGRGVDNDEIRGAGAVFSCSDTAARSARFTAAFAAPDESVATGRIGATGRIVVTGRIGATGRKRGDGTHRGDGTADETRALSRGCTHGCSRRTVQVHAGFTHGCTHRAVRRDAP